MNQIPKAYIRLFGLGAFGLGSLYVLDKCRFSGTIFYNIFLKIRRLSYLY